MAIETAALVSTAAPLVKTLIEKLVTPKLDSFAGWCKIKYKEVMIPTAEHFQEYLVRSYDKYSTINTLVFHNSQRKLKDIYVAQSLVKENRFENDNKSILIDRFPIELIKEYKKILITDTAGMGKSTMMKRMFINLIDNGFADVGIPIYIELNRLDKEHNILSEIREELNSLSEEFDNELLLKLIQTGGFVFFMDGYDEISIKDRNEVSIDIHSFISKAGNSNYFILTSRPESGLASFGDFQSFRIQPLSKEQAFELLRKYDMSNNKELSNKLVKLLDSGQYDTVDEYLVNPLLTSLLFTAYDYNRSIPFEKHRFYGLVFEAYFEKQDVTKPIKTREKKSKLNFDGFDSVMRYVGYKCLTNIGVKFGEDTILNIIREAREYRGNLFFSERDLLNDLITSVPLFCREGTDRKWVHKSLMEYFAARFIFCDAKQKQDDILSRIYRSENVEKYINLLDLYYDIDNHGFMKNIELPLLQEYILFYESNIYDSSHISKRLIEERIGLLFNQTIFVDGSWEVGAWKGVDTDLFETMKGRIQRYYGIDTHSGAFVLPYFYICKVPKPQRKIVDLVRLKHGTLFEKKAIDFDLLDSYKDKFGLQKINCHTGEEDEKKYKVINESIKLIEKGSSYFNIIKCYEEVKIIKTIIQKKEYDFSIFEGI